MVWPLYSSHTPILTRRPGPLFSCSSLVYRRRATSSTPPKPLPERPTHRPWPWVMFRKFKHGNVDDNARASPMETFVVIFECHCLVPFLWPCPLLMSLQPRRDNPAKRKLILVRYWYFYSACFHTGKIMRNSVGCAEEVQFLLVVLNQTRRPLHVDKIHPIIIVGIFIMTRLLPKLVPSLHTHPHLTVDVLL
jgi:hypothetical protein